ncbi:MAG: 3-deoxy-7-phosphoheptulonate synthase, partial [Kiritimatiellia bacterium]
AEYLLVNGCTQVVLCERGLRSFDPSTRNLLDLGGVAVAKQLSHLPIIVDPSHAAGARSLVPPLARAAIAAGADGLIVEAHPDPLNAFSDAAQQLESGKFRQFLDDLAPWIELARRQRQAPSPV